MLKFFFKACEKIFSLINYNSTSVSKYVINDCPIFQNYKEVSLYCTQNYINVGCLDQILNYYNYSLNKSLVINPNTIFKKYLSIKFFILLLFLKTKLSQCLVTRCFSNYYPNISCNSISTGVNSFTVYFIIVVVGDQYCVKQQEIGENAGTICTKGKKALI